jgi:hypothetical protein
MERKNMRRLTGKYPLNMGRYLTQEEREDLRRRVPATGPDWSSWNPVVSKQGWVLIEGLGPLLTKVLQGRVRKDEGNKLEKI